MIVGKWSSLIRVSMLKNLVCNITNIFSIVLIFYITTYGNAFALITNPAQGTVVSTSDTIQYNTTVAANSVNNLNINNSAAGQTYVVNVLSGGSMTNSTVLRDIINVTGSLSFNLTVNVNSGGSMLHNSPTKEILDDDGTGAGTTRLVVSNGGTTTGRYTGNTIRTQQIDNSGTMHGDHRSIWSVVNSSTGIMDQGDVSLVDGGTVTNSGIMQRVDGSQSGTSNTITNNSSGSMRSILIDSGTITNSGTITDGLQITHDGTLNNTGNTGISYCYGGTNVIFNNNGAGVIGGFLFAGTGSELRVGPTTSNAFSTQSNVQIPTITLFNASSFTVNAGHTVSGFTSFTGARPVTINTNGVIQIDNPNSFATTSTVANSGVLRVNNTFNPSGMTLTNSNGIVEVNLAGAITTNISGSGASTFRLGTSSSVTFTTQGTISGFATFLVDANSASLTANHLISGVSTEFKVNQGCSATLNVAPTGSGSFTNNGTVTTGVNNAIGLTGVFTNSSTGTINVNHNISTASFTTPVNNGIININNVTFSTNALFTNNGILNVNNTSGAISGQLVGGAGSELNIGPVTANTFVASNTISDIQTIKVEQGSFSSAFAVSNVATNFDVAVGQSATFTAALTGAGTGSLSNQGTFTFDTNSSISNFASVTNNNNMLVTGSTTNNTLITNLATMTISSTLSGTGSVTNNNPGELTFANGTINSIPITNNRTFNVSGSSSNSALLTNNDQMTISNALLGVGTISNSTSAILTFEANTDNENTVTNDGLFQVTGSSINSALLTNNNMMSIASSLQGSGSILNTSSGANLYLLNGANTTHIITNDFGNNINTSGSIITTDINNSGSALLAANTHDLSGGIFNTTSSGDVTVSGTIALNNGNYDNAGYHYTSITDSVTFDQLNVDGDVDMSGGTIFVNASPSLSGTWPVVTASGLITGPSFEVFPSAAGSLFGGWSGSVIGNAYVVTTDTQPFITYANGFVNQEIANVLDAMASNITNSGQQILIDAFKASTDEATYNAALQQMRPNTNANIPYISTQTAIFTKVEKRIASLDQALSNFGGISAGDIDATTAMWVGGFGSFAKQTAHGENFGYTSDMYGLIIGFDKKMRSECVFGVGFALSRAIIDELINPDCNTKITGYHLLLYGNRGIDYNTTLEWLFTGAVTANNGSRYINVNGVVMSTGSNYHAYQGAGRLNFVYDSEIIEPIYLSPLAMVQYSAAYCPSYYENYSPAALFVSPTHYQNVVTAGAGARLSFAWDEWWMFGTREIRVLGTYDVITSKNNIVSNFLVGSNTFAITNPAASRIALKTGIDVGFAFGDNIQVQISYDYELRVRYTDQSVSAKLKLVF